MPQSHQTSAFKGISTAMSSSLETVYQKIVNFAKSPKILAGKSSAKMHEPPKEKQPARPGLQSGILPKWETALPAFGYAPLPCVRAALRGRFLMTDLVRFRVRN
jgi:hypothetical protein